MFEVSLKYFRLQNMKYGLVKKRAVDLCIWFLLAICFIPSIELNYSMMYIIFFSLCKLAETVK